MQFSLILKNFLILKLIQSPGVVEPVLTFSDPLTSNRQ